MRWQIRFFGVVLLGLLSVGNVLAEGFLDRASRLGNSLKEVGNSLQAGLAGSPVAPHGDRVISYERTMSNFYTFEDFLGGRYKDSSANLRPVISPPYVAFYFPGNGVYSEDGQQFSTHRLQGFLQNGYGYANAEQMFCISLKSVLIESERPDQTSRTNTEVINEIINGFGSVKYSRSGDYTWAKIKFIDSFGGDLSPNSKQGFLNLLKSKSMQEIEAIRFYNEEEARSFVSECYKFVSGDHGHDPNEFIAPESDYLLSKYPEFRAFVANSRAEAEKNAAIESARHAHDRRVQLERAAKEQEIEIARQQAIELRRQKDLEQARKVESVISERSKIIEAENKRKVDAANMESERIEAETRKKRALEAIGQ